MPSFPSNISYGDPITLCLDIKTNSAIIDEQNVGMDFILFVDNVESAAVFQPSFTGNPINQNADEQLCFTANVPEITDPTLTYNVSLQPSFFSYTQTNCQTNTFGFELNTYLLTADGEDVNSLFTLLTTINNFETQVVPNQTPIDFCPTIYVNQYNLPSLPEGLTAGDDLQLCFDIAVDETTFNPENIEFDYILLVDNMPSTVELENVYSNGTASDPNATGQVCFRAPVPGVADSCATYIISLEIISIFYNDDSCSTGTVSYDLNLPNYGFELQGEDLNELIPLLALAGFNPLEVEILAPSGCAGCTDPNACNYNPNLTIDDGSCAEFDCEGDCGGMATPGSNCDDGLSFTTNDTYQDDCTCSGDLLGCTDVASCNYNPYALVEDNSCLTEGEPCDDGNTETVNDLIDSNCDCTGVVGLSTLNESQIVNVYPTIFNDKLQLSFNENENSNAILKVYSSTGVNVISETIQVFSNSNFTYNTSHYSTGIYIVTIQLNDKIYTQKVLKQ